MEVFPFLYKDAYKINVKENSFDKISLSSFNSIFTSHFFVLYILYYKKGDFSMVKKNKKMDFKKMKKNAFKSLNEVEFFLHDFKKFSNYIKLYKILK